MKKWNSLTLNQQLAQIEVTEEQRTPMKRKYAVRCAPYPVLVLAC